MTLGSEAALGMSAEPVVHLVGASDAARARAGDPAVALCGARVTTPPPPPEVETCRVCLDLRALLPA